MRLATQRAPSNPDQPVGPELLTIDCNGRPSCNVVEDQSDIGKLVSDMLLAKGVAVEVFAFGSDLSKSLNLFKFKTVFLNLLLPDIDGFLLMEKLAALSFHTPILMISGHSGSMLEAALLHDTELRAL